MLTVLRAVDMCSTHNVCAELAEDLHIMHQQPPRPHREAEAPDAEPSNVSKGGAAEPQGLRFSKAGSMIGRPPVTAQAAAPQLPARLSQATVVQELPSPAQQEGTGLAAGPSNVQGGGQNMSMVRFSQPHSPSQPLQAVEQQQSNELWSAAAHLQAIEMLLDVARHTPSSPQVALQHAQSISLLCQACMASLTGVQGASKATAPLQSMQSLCQSATEASLQQAHAQYALWVSLRLLCRTVSSTFTM